MELQYQNTMHRRSPMHENEFRPTACSRTMYSPLDLVPTLPISTWNKSKTRKRRQGKMRAER